MTDAATSLTTAEDNLVGVIKQRFRFATFVSAAVVIATIAACLLNLKEAWSVPLLEKMVTVAGAFLFVDQIVTKKAA